MPKKRFPSDDYRSLMKVIGVLAFLIAPQRVDAAEPASQATMAPMPGMTMGSPPSPTTTPPVPDENKKPTAAPSSSPTPMMDMPEMHDTQRQRTSPVTDKMKSANPSMDSMNMPSITDLGDPMSQDGSGTSWVPRSTQMFGWMRSGPRDMQMTHGAIFPRYDSSGSQRGDRRADAPNWFMFMGTHAISASSQVAYTAMLSADFLTENESGYPLLFESGETAHGVPLHDHQHPHDLFSELAVDYSARLGKTATGYLYLGYPGEPALGPPAFMHRRIAYDMPDSTIGHHWQDASHIQFGVATAGFAPSSHVKLEASTFTGREPNEIRTNFDPIHLDSYSQRLSWNPNDNTAAEVSFAFISSPEVSDPQINQHRLVASLLLNKPLGPDRNWYNGFLFGQNIETGGGRTNSYLGESDYQLGRSTAFARVELGTRSARDLVIPSVNPDTVYHIGAYTLGAVRDLTRNPSATNIGIGGQFTLGSKSAGLDAYYGSATPLGYELFFRLRPPDMAHSMASMSGMSMGSH